MKATHPIYVINHTSEPRNVSLVSHDPVSRYKTKQLVIQERGARWVRTYFINNRDVCKCMQVPESWLVTYVGYELNVPSKMSPLQEPYISGHHPPEEINVAVASFIEEVVSCKVCLLPEVDLSLESKKLTAKCRACPTKRVVSFKNEKFEKFITKELRPLESDGGRTTSSFDSEKVLPRERKTSFFDLDVLLGQSSEEWFSDTSEEAVLRRREKYLPKNLKAVGIDAEELKAFIGGSLEKITESKLISFRMETGISSEDFVGILFEVLLDSGKSFVSVIDKGCRWFKVIVEPKSERVLLDLVINYALVHNLKDKIPVVLQLLYSREVVDEKTSVEWIDRYDSEEFKGVVSPFLEWLQNAEEE